MKDNEVKNNLEYNYNEYLDSKDRERLAKMLLLSRAESGLSQEKVALELGIAKKTVQNWERGISAPTLPQAIAWFKVMKVAAMPYFLQFMFPDMENIDSNNDDELRDKLISLIETMPAEGIRQLMFLFYGDHGSSPRGIINMLTAHLKSPMRDRYNHARAILDDYKISKEIKKPSDLEKKSRFVDVEPDTEFLEKAITEGRKAVVGDIQSYIALSPNGIAIQNACKHQH